MQNYSEFPKLTLVTGGISSGKSLWVEGFVKRASKRKTYLATAMPLDDELNEKIRQHQERRGENWQLLEDPFTDGSVFLKFGESDIILFECMSTWLGNLLYKKVDLEVHLNNFLANLTTSNANIVVVSVESGSGVIPMDETSRTFVKELGTLNRRIAGISDLTILITAGLPLVIKGHLPS